MSANKENLNTQNEINKAKQQELDLARALYQVEEERKATLESVFDNIQRELNELTKEKDARRQALGAARQMRNVTRDLYNDAAGIVDLDSKKLDKLQEQNKASKAYLELLKTFPGISEEDKNNIDQILSQYGRLNNVIAKRAKAENVINKNMGVASGLVEGIASSMRKGGFGNLVNQLGIDSAVKNAKSYTKLLTQGGTKSSAFVNNFKVAGKLVTQLGKNFLKALGPVYLITELVQGIVRADKETTALGKSLAMSKMEATVFRENMAAAARDSGNMAVTGTKLAENFNKLNTQLGFINNFTLDTLITMTKLTETVGLSAEIAGNLSSLSEARGKNAEAEYKTALLASYELQRQSGIQQDLKVLLKASSKVTGQIRANLGANTVEIMKAVTLATELGGSLEDVKTISSSILNFESSIAKELEAEVLTGKELNLEKARLAALNGNILKFEKEIVTQLGTFTEFSKMNVIQQDALASAFGISSDKLSDMLFRQQVMGRSAQELRAAGEDELANRIEQLSMQEKFNKTVEKLKAIFTDVGQAFMPVLQLLGFALSIVGLIASLITDILSMLKGDFDFSSTMASIESLGSQLGSFETLGSMGGGGNTENGRRPSNSKSGSSTNMERTNQLLEQLLNKDTSLFMDGRKLNDSMVTNGQAYNIGGPIQ